MSSPAINDKTKRYPQILTSRWCLFSEGGSREQTPLDPAVSPRRVTGLWINLGTLKMEITNLLRKGEDSASTSGLFNWRPADHLDPARRSLIRNITTSDHRTTWCWIDSWLRPFILLFESYEFESFSMLAKRIVNQHSQYEGY